MGCGQQLRQRLAESEGGARDLARLQGVLEARGSELDQARQQVVEIRSRWYATQQDLRDCERSHLDLQQQCEALQAEVAGRGLLRRVSSSMPEPRGGGDLGRMTFVYLSIEAGLRSNP